MITLETCVSQSPQCLSTEVDGQTVLMSVQSGVYGGLDAIGTAIWAKMASPRRVGDMCEELAAEYRAPRSRVEEDVLNFLNQLDGKQMLTVVVSAT